MPPPVDHVTLPRELQSDLDAFDRTLALVLDDATRKAITDAATQLVWTAYARGRRDHKEGR